MSELKNTLRELYELSDKTIDEYEVRIQNLEKKLKIATISIDKLSETYPECALICIKILNLINRSDTE